MPPAGRESNGRLIVALSIRSRCVSFVRGVRGMDYRGVIKPKVLPLMIRNSGARGRLVRCATVLATMSLVTACSTLPSSGPTARGIQHGYHQGAAGTPGHLPFQVVEVTTPTALPPVAVVPQSTLALPMRQPTDLIGPGDVLNITIYEVGVSLFGTALRTAATAGATGVDTSSSAERLPT